MIEGDGVLMSVDDGGQVSVVLIVKRSQLSIAYCVGMAR